MKQKLCKEVPISFMYLVGEIRTNRKQIEDHAGGSKHGRLQRPVVTWGAVEGTVVV